MVSVAWVAPAMALISMMPPTPIGKVEAESTGAAARGTK